MLKTDKERIVSELTERLRAADTLILADYRGLSMTQIDDLRTKLLQHGAKFSVVKNTLTRRAAEAAGTTALLALLEGPTAIAFLESDGDPVGVAKALSDAAKSTRVLTLKGGLLEGKPISEEEVANLATLPSTDTLRAQLVGALAGPMTAVVGLFAAPMRDLVGVLDARIRQLEDQGGGAPERGAEAEQPAPEAEAAPDPEPAAEAEAEQPEDEPSEPATSETTSAQAEPASNGEES